LGWAVVRLDAAEEGRDAGKGGNKLKIEDGKLKMENAKKPG
jgi:hypothetical protein